MLLALTLGAAVLRFATLDVQSIWLDESATMILVRRGFGAMLSHLSASESAPPLYYVLLWVWTRIVGIGPLGFRTFSALAGSLTVPVMYAAGRRVSPRAALWAAALTAFSPAMYYYSQEARVYVLLVLFSAAALALWLRAYEQPDRRSLGWWSALSCLALLTHYFAIFLFIPEAVLLALRIGWRRLLAPVAAVLVVGAALVPLAAAERAGGKASWIEAESLLSRAAESVKLFAVGVYAPLEIPLGAIVIALSGLAAVLLWRRGSRGERSAGGAVAVVTLGALALPLLLAASHLIDVYDGRNVIATWAPLAVLVAAGLGAARAARAGVVLGVALLAASAAVIAAVDLSPTYQRDDWRGIAHALGRPAGRRVVVAPEFASLPLYVYMGPLRGVSSATVSTPEIDFATLRQRRSARAPLPPPVPATAPRGFVLAGVRRTSTYAVTRYVAAHPQQVVVSSLRAQIGERHADVIVQR